MSASDTPDHRDAPDLRLAPLVAAVWLGQALVLLRMPSQPTTLALIAGSALLLGLVGVTAWLRLRRGSQPGAASGRAVVGFLLLSGLALGTAVGGMHLARLHPPALAAAVHVGSVVQVEALVTGDPVVRLPADVGGRPMPARWSVGARLSAVQLRGRSYSVRAPVLLRGDQVRALRYGSVVALTGRAQESWSPEVQSFALAVLGEVQVRSPPGPAARITTRIREAFRAACSGLPPDAAALLLGLAVGDESLVSPELDAAMIRSGLAHLTAVSGSNTSLVVAIAMSAVVGLGLGWRIRVGVCLAVLWGYVLLVRPEPSVLRAAVMGVVALIALSTGGRRRGPPALLASGLVLLLVLPQFALSMGFALSFAATAGLLVVGPPIADQLGRWILTGWVPEPIRAALAVAAAAHLATLPLVILMGNGASLVALPANVLVTPLVPLATVLGLAAALIAPVAPALAAALATAASPATWLIARVAHVSSELPYGVIDVLPGPVGALGAAAVLGLVGVALARGWRPLRHRRVVLAVALATAVGVGMVRARTSDWPPPGWVVLACDVGQGDGLLIRRQGSTEALLVDAGPEGDRITSCLKSAHIDRLTILLTHFHADHIDGLAAVLAHLPVDAILTTAVPEPAEGASAVLGIARRAGVPIRPVQAGARVLAGGVPLAILWPARRISESPANNASVVALAAVSTVAGPVTVLLTGDIEPEAQTVLLAGPSPGAAVVKVPHHGSRYQEPEFARWSGARIALVCVGLDNDYGHPSATTLDQYRAAGARIGRTDQQGDLAVVAVGARLALIPRR
jgi:competence protein ComEC